MERAIYNFLIKFNIRYLLKSNMEIIVNLKLKIKELDLDNQDLVSENEQLRKTSMDGIFL